MHQGPLSLAVFIPYYKKKYLEQLLRALAGQTDSSFSVYIIDDCSPDSPCDVISDYASKLLISYHRFDDNVGSRCLASQWNRCLALCQDEEWIWFLPDDDLPGCNCVESFRMSLAKHESHSADVWVFPLSTIDSQGHLIGPAMYRGMGIESNYSFYLRQLTGISQGSSLGENIFRTCSLKSTGGFVAFPKGWGSDHATIIRVSSLSGVGWIENSDFYFRMSQINISGDTSDGHIKMKARLMFAQWLKRNAELLGEKPSALFWRCVYFKAEHYFLWEWSFSWPAFLCLIRIRRVCLGRWLSPCVILLLLRKLSPKFSLCL